MHFKGILVLFLDLLSNQNWLRLNSKLDCDFGLRYNHACWVHIRHTNNPHKLPCWHDWWMYTYASLGRMTVTYVLAKSYIRTYSIREENLGKNYILLLLLIENLSQPRILEREESSHNTDDRFWHDWGFREKSFWDREINDKIFP